MKANEAEKIYVNSDGYPINTKRSDDHDIECVRKDAFIEKAWEWIEDNMLSSNQQDKSRLYYEQFKKYLEE